MVAARVSGRVINVKVDDNQRVKARDVLFELGLADYRTHVRQAEANLAAAEAQAQAAPADLTITPTSAPAAFALSRTALHTATAQAQRAQADAKSTQSMSPKAGLSQQTHAYERG